ncbi:MAG: class I SAM-dependent methyltransferase, partial [Dehalococcoidia bacterium]|nr:class I SAM-dependent methyltransferase [Dehalococcoidia bacterium]
MAIRGIGQAPDSPVTGTAAWLSSICAIMSKDPWYGPILNDPFAMHFAGAISDQAPALLAEYDDPARRQALIEGYGSDLGTLTVVCYRKPQMQRQVREALDATGARQLVIMGAGCDSLSLRLAAEGYRPRVYEIDRPAVTEFRAGVLRSAPIDASHIEEVGVDFDHQVFGQVLLEA